MILKITLIIFTLLASFLGGISNQFTDWTWYELLNKSDLNPPNYIFGFGLANTLFIDGNS